MRTGPSQALSTVARFKLVEILEPRSVLVVEGVLRGLTRRRLPRLLLLERRNSAALSLPRCIDLRSIQREAVGLQLSIPAHESCEPAILKVVGSGAVHTCIGHGRTCACQSRVILCMAHAGQTDS